MILKIAKDLIKDCKFYVLDDLKRKYSKSWQGHYSCFEVFMVVIVKIVVFWFVTLCRLVNRY
jgi:hypothetical protein